MHAPIGEGLLGLGNTSKIYPLQRESTPSLGARTRLGAVAGQATDILRKLRIHPRHLCIKQTRTLQKVPDESLKTIFTEVDAKWVHHPDTGALVTQ